MSKVLAMCGSLRPESVTRRALLIALEGATAAGAQVEQADLGTLPLFNEAAREHEAVARFKEQVRLADALLIATPVYHDSLSGVVKNAIDFLYDELADKVAALIAVSGGRTGQGQALEHLRAALRETGTWTLPRQVGIGQSKDAFTPQGRPVDREIESRLSMLGKELVLRSRMLSRPRPR